ncbi:MAG TPA: UDP-2,3-diacylglucosamine diphosphatase LpxI [Candidatus Gastranaerophilales bacterium]|nr:UDP-2,3-diacylglucosamine diphosphatase LpxI [Candidatus Gastranaerophilales bacterium]
MDTILSKKIGLIAGDGELPVKLAKSAQNQGFEVVTISVIPSNKRKLEAVCKKVYSKGPGEVQAMIDIMKGEGVNQISFIGKVHKGLLFRPILDARARKMVKDVKRLNDDSVMLRIIKELKEEDISVLDQTIFLKEFFPKKGVIGRIKPDENQLADIEYGFQIAKEIGRLDLGQSVVAQDKMILAVETIEGTDKTIERGCKMGNGKATVVKVSKPEQDKRFDMPTVGLRTLETMKKYGANVLAIEADETFAIEIDKMIEFANKHNIVFIAV